MKPTHLTLCVALSLAAALTAQRGRRLYETFGNGFLRAGGYGRAMALIGDINRDGIPDLAAGDQFDQSTRNGSGLVELVSGTDGRVLRRLLPANQDSQLGVAVAGVGDINLDSTPDVFVASRSRATLYSGSTGNVLRTVAVRATSVAGPGDWNGDRRRDLALVDSGSLRVVSGADGSNLATIAVAGAREVIATGGGLAVSGSGGVSYFRTGQTTAAWTRPGYSGVGELGDLNRDGTPDLLARSATAVDALDGRNGNLIRRFPSGSSARGGHDLNRDGVIDVAIGNPLENGVGAARAYSGADASLLFEYFGQEQGDLLGFQVATHPGAGVPGRPSMVLSVESRFNGSVESGSVMAVAQALGGEFDGAFRPFGVDCSFMRTRQRAGRDLPRIGASYFFRFDNNTTPQGFMFLVIGTSRTSWRGVPLPLRLPGPRPCNLLVGPDAIVRSNLSSFVSLPIPNDLALVRQTVYLQGVSYFQPSFETSDASEILIGN